MLKYIKDVLSPLNNVATRYQSLTTDQRAAWITAIFTAVQTVAVVVTFAVAAVEFYGHEQQDLRTQREAVIKLFTDEPSDVQQARQLAETLALCIRSSTADPSKSPDEGLLHCPKPFPTDNEARRQLTSLISYLSRVSLCRQTKICDEQLSMTLYCADVNNVFTATQRKGVSIPMFARDALLDYRAGFTECLSPTDQPN